MGKEIINEIKQMQKLMLYNWAKTDTENTQIFEQIIGTPPDASGGGNAGGGNAGGGNAGGNTQPRRTLYTIPPELKDGTGVKAFQDWVVSKGKTSELGRFGADGKFGRFTSAAWTKYKNDYLNPVLTDTDVMASDDFQAAGAVYSSTQPTSQTNTVNTGTQTTTNTVAVPLDGTAPTNVPIEPTDKQTPDSL
jgi:hypothetical protein